MDQIIIDVANIIRENIQDNNVIFIKSFHYFLCVLTIIWLFIFCSILLVKDDLKTKIHKPVGIIFIGLIFASAITLYLMNEKEKLSPIELSNINDKLLKLIEEKKLIKDDVKEISKKILLCDGGSFHVFKRDVDCYSYNEKPKKSHIIKNLNTIETEKNHENFPLLNDNIKEKEDGSQVLTNKDLNI